MTMTYGSSNVGYAILSQLISARFSNKGYKRYKDKGYKGFGDTLFQSFYKNKEHFRGDVTK